KVAWSITDDHADSMKKMTIDNATFAGDQAWSSTNQYGVGKTAGGVNIGAYSVGMNSNVTVDGNVKALGYSAIADDPMWLLANTGSQLVTHSDGSIQYSALNSSDRTLVPFMNAVFPLRVALAVQKTDTLAITDDTPIDGQATITLHYL
ncbi:DUF1120 domain-containing protein, partial [Enterobacter hormaechei]